MVGKIGNAPNLTKSQMVAIVAAHKIPDPPATMREKVTAATALIFALLGERSVEAVSGKYRINNGVLYFPVDTNEPSGRYCCMGSRLLVWGFGETDGYLGMSPGQGEMEIAVRNLLQGRTTDDHWEMYDGMVSPVLTKSFTLITLFNDDISRFGVANIEEMLAEAALLGKACRYAALGDD